MNNILRFNNCKNIEELYGLLYGNVMENKEEFEKNISKNRTIKNILNCEKFINKVNKNIIDDKLKITSLELDNVNTVYDIHEDIYTSINEKMCVDVPNKKCTIICFSMISYEFRIQRNQHICKLMSEKGHTVIYLNTIFSDVIQINKLYDNLHQVTLNCGNNNLNVYTSKLEQENIIKLLQSIDTLKKKFNFDFFVAYVANPFWYQLLKYINNTHIIYDCMDYHEGFGNISSVVVDNEKYLIENCDTLVVTSPILVSKLNIKPNTYKLIRNGCDYNYFSSIYKKKNNKKTIGYYGAVSDWFDVELVRKIALMYSDCNVYIIGNVLCNNAESTKKINDLKTISNIKFFGEINYFDLHEYVCYFDVGIIPFIINPLIECTNPVKLYEMLSMGLPVVMTKMPDVLTLEQNNLYYVSENHNEFLVNIYKALEETINEKTVNEKTANEKIANEKIANEKIAKRKEYAIENTWDNRVKIFEDIVNNVYPLISIVLLCFNNWALTSICIDSVLNNTNYENYELIIVNNNSSDKTMEELKKYNQSNIRIINNKENYGFALGMNIGALYARGEYVVLLNNDTYCMKDWLYGMVKPFFKYDNCGIVSPITNNCGNEIKQFIIFDNIEDLKKKSKKLQINKKYKIKQHDRVPFFCPMVNKIDFYRCGLLDSNFGRGGWEDDDVIYRYNIMNKKNYYTYASFVYHQESATITDGYVPTTSKNKYYYEKKWNCVWLLPKYKYVKINIYIDVNDDDLKQLFSELEYFINHKMIVDVVDENTVIIGNVRNKTTIKTIIHPDYYMFDTYKYSRKQWGLLNLYSVLFTKKYCS